MVEAQQQEGKKAEREEMFVQFLVELQENERRGALAALRRGLGKEAGAAPEMFPLIVPWTHDLGPEVARWYYTMASLFALHPSNTDEPRHNFGTTMRRVREKTRAGGKGEAGEGEGEARKGRREARGEEQRGADRFDAVERRFIALLRCHPNDLGEHLRHAVSLAASKEEPVNWAQLLRDVQRWDHPDRYVQMQWANAFWGWEKPTAGEEGGEHAAEPKAGE